MRRYLSHTITKCAVIILIVACLYIAAFFKLRRHNHVTVLEFPTPSRLDGWKGANFCWFSEDQTTNTVCFYIFLPMEYATGKPVEDISLEDAVATRGRIYVRKLDILIALNAMWQ